MNRSPQTNFSRGTIILVLLAAWFALSNHCALATLGRATAQAKSAQVHRCCSEKLPTQEDAPRDNTGVCCKSLRVLPQEAAAKLIEPGDALISAPFIWVEVPRSAETNEPILMLSGGPPGARSFAEAVLQQSLLSHAPPLGS